MPRPHCAELAAVAQPRRTARGYRTCRCHGCRRICNERSGTPCNHRQAPTDIVLLVVRWRLRDTLRLRDLAKLFLARGIVFSHEAVRDWAARWCSLYRAIDRDGNLVEARLSEKRDMAAARRCFARALETVGHAPERATTDGHDAYPRASRETLGTETGHRCSRDKHNRIAQDHRGITYRDDGSFVSAARCGAVCAEQRQYCRAQDRSDEPLSPAARRQQFQGRWAAVMAELAAA